MFRGVCFDLDGTLLDSLKDLANAMNQTLSGLGLPQHPLSTYKQFVGDGVDFLARRALPPDHQDQAFLEQVIERYRAHYQKKMSENTRPYEGILELLDVLQKARIKLAVLSNKPDDPTQHLVKLLFGKIRFDHIQGARADIPKKPDPAAALETARMMKIFPAECVYIGDTGTDMKTAVHSGMFPVGVLWGFRGAQELLEAGAKILISKPRELMQVVFFSQN